MDCRFLISEAEGNWIVQKTTYSLLKNRMCTSVNQVQWKAITNCNNNIRLLSKKIAEKYFINHSNIYIKEYKSSKASEKFYEFFLYNDKLNRGYIIKLNNSSKIISTSFFTCKNNKYFSINHQSKNLCITESIYFVQRNLKIIKSLIKQNECCIGVSFASEIKIS